MKADFNKNGSKLTVALEGDLDTLAAPELKEQLRPALEGVDDLVFDMTNLRYISSSGLRVLLSAQKVMNKQGDMHVIHVSDEVMEIFDVTGFTDILSIE